MNCRLLIRSVNIIKKIDYSYIIGKRYGRITVVKKDEFLSLKLKKEYYMCICDCGKEKSMRATDLHLDKIKSCGCFKPPQYKNIKNQKYGKLIALEYRYTFNKKAYWMCKCECDNVVIVSSSNLCSGHTTTCGCKQKASYKGKLSKHFRNLAYPQVLKCLEFSGYSCYLTGSKDSLEVHHLNSFLNIYMDAIKILDLPIFDDFDKYNKEEKNEIDAMFLELHNKAELIVLCKKVHVQFHKEYGYKNNFKQQFIDFKKNFNSEEP